MPFIIMRRTDIPNGILQVIDLKPNTSQRSFIYDPGDGQSGYIRNIPASDNVLTTGAGPIVTNADYCGLAAYLLDNVEDSSTTAITAAVANAAAASMIAKCVAGTAMTLVEMDLSLTANGVADATAGTGVEAGASTGLFTEVLNLLQGSKYLLPGGAEIAAAAAAFNPVRLGSFTFLTRVYYPTGAFNISNGDGNLSDFKRADFEYNGTMGPAIVVYDDTGAVA